MKPPMIPDEKKAPGTDNNPLIVNKIFLKGI